MERGFMTSYTGDGGNRDMEEFSLWPLSRRGGKIHTSMYKQMRSMKKCTEQTAVIRILSWCKALAVSVLA